MEKSMQQYKDHAKNGFYSFHLSEICNKGNQAFTTSDIVNDRGVLLARKGVNIDQKVRQKLIKHKLLKPLDDDIGLKHQADTKALIREFRELLEKYPDLKVVDEAMHFGREFERLLYLEKLHPQVTQKLTILQTQMHPEFEKCIFSAWMSTMIAQEMGLSLDERRDTLVAALIHDVGLLHLDPDIVCSNRKLSAEEWKTVRAHVVVGKYIADSMPGISSEVSRAVAEHHEDCFGAGYPRALNEKQLGVPGKIIGMTDSVHSIRVKSFRNSKRTLGDIKPFLQLNPATRGHDVYRATMSILKKSGLTQTKVRPNKSSSEYAKGLGKQVDILGEAKKALDHIHQNLETLNDKIDAKSTKQLTSVAAITCRIRSTIHESGLLSSEIAEWLHQGEDVLENDEQVFDELNEIELLIKELTWQIRNTVRMFHSYSDSSTTKDKLILEHIETSIHSIQRIFDLLHEVQA